MISPRSQVALGNVGNDSGGIIERSLAIYRRVRGQKCSVPSGRLITSLIIPFKLIRPSRTCHVHFQIPGDKSPGYSQASLWNFRGDEGGALALIDIQE
jgi:hypothetical protein